MYINIFTNQSFQEASIEVVNISVEDKNKPLLYSTGIHPWYVNDENLSKYLEMFFILSSEKQCIAIGECGLDMHFENTLKAQEKAFIQQIKTANFLKKPLIVYAHKSWKQIKDILIKHKNKMPLIIPEHSLPQNISEIEDIHNYYIAFNKSIYLQSDKAIKWLKTLSSKKILFYSNDNDINIKDIYEAASKLLSIDTHTLQHQILENFYKAFLIEKLPI